MARHNKREFWFITLSTLAAASGEAQADTAPGRGIVRATTREVLARLAALHETAITGADLSAVVEATLIEAGQYEVAKALVVIRALPGASRGCTRSILPRWA